MSKDKEKFYEAVDRVVEKLCSMPDQEFARALEARKDGDIAKILLETGALRVGEIEAEAFDDYSAPYVEGDIDFSFLQSTTGLNDWPTVVLGTVKRVNVIKGMTVVKNPVGYVSDWKPVGVLQIPDQIEKIEFGAPYINSSIMEFEKAFDGIWDSKPQKNKDQKELGLAA